MALARHRTSGTTEAGLHLIDDQHRAALAAQPRGLVDELLRGRTHATLALDELDDERRRLRGDRRIQRFGLVERDMGEALEERPEELPVFRSPGGGERAHGLAVKATHCRDDPLTLRREMRELQRALDRLRTAVAEEQAIERCGQEGGQLVVELRAAVVVEELGAARERSRLRRDRVGHRGIAVAQIGHPLSADAVDVLASRVIPHDRANAAHEHDVALLIEPRGVGVLARDDITHGSPSGPADRRWRCG